MNTELNKQDLVPILDYNELISGEEGFNSFVQKMLKPATTTGFFFLRNSTINEENVVALQKDIKSFFAQPENVRLAYENIQDRQRGYTSLGVEKGEFANDADEKHFVQFGEEGNVPIKEVPEFLPDAERLFADFQRVGLMLLSAFAVAARMPRDYFVGKEGNSVLRCIEYPANENPMHDDGLVAKGGNHVGMCASKHTDINLITLLIARSKGLQLWYEDQWIDVITPEPGLVVVNVGDMLQHLTNDFFKSVMHRVVCEKNVTRISMPFFLHLKPGESIKPVEHLGPVNRKKFPWNFAYEYFNHVMQKINMA
ncbi:MAG TPA: 2-oxoglutarate and iron-dependent oxygenase domain-containing protein [Candidatus Paceibacterota bacterium]|nr:2-oxoglutarate and iron-dependent oxygenase domain-containing protein [Candidatus Paceibacterota bacterium]